jgi:hypothetical protein
MRTRAAVCQDWTVQYYLNVKGLEKSVLLLQPGARMACLTVCDVQYIDHTIY